MPSNNAVLYTDSESLQNAPLIFWKMYFKIEIRNFRKLEGKFASLSID